MVKRIACIVGARPNFIKMAAILEEIRQRPALEKLLIHTGQHSSPEMSGCFFDDLRLPEPDVFLEVSGGTGTQQTAMMMQKLEATFAERKPDLVLVVGDVNSTLAAAMVAAKAGIPLAHVEAGLRSFDRRMPEEINRLMTDAVADYLFTSERQAEEQLRREGVAPERIHFAGNVMIDTLLRFRGEASRSQVLTTLGLKSRGYAVATLHRPSNVDDPAKLRELLAMLERLDQRLPVVFPIHPRTRRRMAEAGVETRVRLVDPLGYLDYLQLMSECRMMLTDSGGIQEETTILQVPCLTLRENTERPATITHGTNRLVGVDPENVLRHAYALLVGPEPNARRPERWDGRAAARILDVLEAELMGGPRAVFAHEETVRSLLALADAPEGDRAAAAERIPACAGD